MGSERRVRERLAPGDASGQPPAARSAGLQPAEPGKMFHGSSPRPLSIKPPSPPCGLSPVFRGWVQGQGVGCERDGVLRLHRDSQNRNGPHSLQQLAADSQRTGVPDLTLPVRAHGSQRPTTKSRPPASPSASLCGLHTSALLRPTAGMHAANGFLPESVLHRHTLSPRHTRRTMWAWSNSSVAFYEPNCPRSMSVLSPRDHHHLSQQHRGDEPSQPGEVSEGLLTPKHPAAAAPRVILDHARALSIVKLQQL